MAIETKGHLLQVDLRNGIIKARMHEGWLTERDIEINIGRDEEFLRRLAHELEVMGGTAWQILGECE